MAAYFSPCQGIIMLNVAQAKAAIGQIFTMSSENLPPQTLKLESVSLSERRNVPEQFRAAFAMHLTGTKGLYCPQGTYQLENPTLGVFEAFIVPIAHRPESDEYTYELI